MRQLDIYYNDTKAGRLTEQCPGSGYVFQYSREYLDSDLPHVSTGLPKRAEAYRSDTLFPFFSNMVPEGANRKAICRLGRIDEDDFFGLLTAMAGRDFIGAVNVRRISDD